MRHPSAYYLLLLYCTVLMRCAIPVACDELSHIFNEEDHIATIHAVYGNNHVEKEIAADEKDNTKSQSTVKYEDQIPVHLSGETYMLTTSTIQPILHSSCFAVVQLQSIFLPKHIPPPRFS